MSYNNRRVIATRKYNGDTYTFIAHDDGAYVTCETPENAFGYPDVVLLGRASYSVDCNGMIIPGDRTYAYTLHRYLQPWILRRIEAVLIKLSVTLTDGLEAGA